MTALEQDPDLDLLRVAAKVELVHNAQGFEAARATVLTAVDWLRVEHVLTHGSELARRAALYLCVFFGDRAAVHAVGQVLRYDSVQTVRRDAARRLAMMETPAAHDELRWIISVESDPEIRDAAANALRQSATAVDLGTLWRALDDENASVAAAANDALTRIFGAPAA